MALVTIRARSTLAARDVLAPERYDPRRELDPGTVQMVPLGDMVTLARQVVQPSADLGRCLVLDTSDAHEGVVISRKTAIDGSAIGSTKKIVEPRDVIISRLRPYLRQVALVDRGIPHAAGARIVCSTEFFVLRPLDKRSIAFLVPFLLSRQVQEVLAASQEGGHHPRSDDTTLLTLPIAVSFLGRRDAISRSVEKAVGLYRKSVRGIDQAVAAAEASFSDTGA